MIDGHFCTPRQVTAGVPGYLDAITIRACLPESRKGQAALTSPAEIAEALADVARPMPIPIAYPPTPAVQSASHSEGLDTERPRPPAAPTQPRPMPRPRRSGGGSMLNRVLMTVVVLLVIAAVGVGAWTIGRSLGSPNDPQAETTPTASASAPPQPMVVVKPEKATGFDPLADTGREGRDGAARHRRQAQHVLEDGELQQRRPGQSQGRRGPAPRHGQVHADRRRGATLAERPARASS